MEFAIGGICNCICCTYFCIQCVFIDPAFSELVVSEKANLKNILRLLSSSNENTLISAMATLYYLMDYPQGLTCMFVARSFHCSPFEVFCPHRAYHLCRLRERKDSKHGILHFISYVLLFPTNTRSHSLLVKHIKPIRRRQLLLHTRLVPRLSSHIASSLFLVSVGTLSQHVLLHVTPSLRTTTLRASWLIRGLL